MAVFQVERNPVHDECSSAQLRQIDQTIGNHTVNAAP
jgi:hypothetical protein